MSEERAAGFTPALGEARGQAPRLAEGSQRALLNISTILGDSPIFRLAPLGYLSEGGLRSGVRSDASLSRITRPG